MKRIVFCLFSVLISATLLSGCLKKKDSNQSALQRIKDKGVIVVGLDDQFPPMGFRDRNGKIVGFDIDLAKAAAKQLGVKVKFKAVSWDGIIFSLKNGDIDLIWNGLTITPARKKAIAITNPYLSDKQIIVVNKDSKIENQSDLKGKIIGLQLGSSSANALDNYKKLKDSLKKTRLYDTNTQALMDLSAGRINAVVIDEVVGRYYINKRPGVYRVLAASIAREQFGVGLRKGDTELYSRLNEILAQMRKDGTEEKISKKWFGVNLLK